MLTASCSLLIHTTLSLSCLFFFIKYSHATLWFLMWNQGQLKVTDWRGREYGVVLFLWEFFGRFSKKSNVIYFPFLLFVIKRTQLLDVQFWLGWTWTYIFDHIIRFHWLLFRPPAPECLSSTCSMHLYFCCPVLESLLLSSCVLGAGPAGHTVGVHRTMPKQSAL